MGWKVRQDRLQVILTQLARSPTCGGEGGKRRMPPDFRLHARPSYPIPYQFDAVGQGTSERRNPPGHPVLSNPMDIDYRTLADDMESGLFRGRLRAELIEGFASLQLEGERLPPPSYYATKIVEVIHAGAPIPLEKEFSYYLYQEALAACEEARAEVLGEEVARPFNPLSPGG
jgi:hypothetical protein